MTSHDLGQRVARFSLLFTSVLAAVGCGATSTDDVEVRTSALVTADLLPFSATTTGLTGTGCSSPYQTCVDDGTNFAVADNTTTVVRTTGTTGTHTLGYSGPGGTVSQVVVHVRASTTSSSTAGKVQVKILNGTTTVATGPSHNLNSSWANFNDTFTGLNISNVNNLKTAVILTRTSGTGSVQVTMAWLSATTTGGGGSGSATLAVQFADTVLSRWPDPHNITGTTRGWDYNNGIVLRGMMEIWKKTNDARYLNYIKQYVDSFLDAAGNLYVDTAHTKTIQTQTFSLDLIQPASLLLFLAQQFPTDTRYMTAATIVRNMFPGFPANGDGGFWHKQAYPNEMWLDGIYMAEPFLVKYGAMTTSCGTTCNDTANLQTTLVANHVLQPSGLLRHGWDWDHNAAWCTGTCAGTSGNGVSPEIWSRAVGWYAMALVDMLDDLPAAHPARATFISTLQGIVAGAQATQDATTGLWCQVTDKCAVAGNWTESSGTGMLVYVIKKAVTNGYLNASALTTATSAYAGLKANKVGADSAGPTIIDSADGMGVQSTFAAYIGIARRTNFYHGLCAIELAAAAMDY